MVLGVLVALARTGATATAVLARWEAPETPASASPRRRLRWVLGAAAIGIVSCSLAFALTPAAPAVDAVGRNQLRLTAFMTPIHRAIDSPASMSVARLEVLAAAIPPPPPPPAPPAPPAPSATTVDTQPAPSSYVDSANAAAWAASPGVVCIREHESGDNYSEDTGNGYYGAYQDLLSTWEAHGGTGLPSDAPPAEQDQINYEIWLSGGWGQWSTAPMCGL